MRATGLLLVPSICACSTVSDAQRIYEMDDAEFDRYVARTSALVGSVAQTALDQGDITTESLDLVVDALRALLEDQPTNTLIERLDLEGYGAIALQITLLELDAKLDQAGAYIGEYLGDRGKAVLDAVAQTLDAVAHPTTE